jgi:transposase-like protein
VHKTANVLNKLPKSQQPKAKRSLQEIWMAETRKGAEAAFDAFLAAYKLKYEKAAACLAKDREALLVFYDFPAEHWKHLRTSNPIESTFATVRHRTIRAKGCLSNTTALAMVFKLVEAAQKSWRRLDGKRRRYSKSNISSHTDCCFTNDAALCWTATHERVREPLSLLQRAARLSLPF